jgi:hypothetical protein
VNRAHIEATADDPLACGASFLPPGEAVTLPVEPAVATQATDKTPLAHLLWAIKENNAEELRRAIARGPSMASSVNQKRAAQALLSHAAWPQSLAQQLEDSGLLPIKEIVRLHLLANKEGAHLSWEPVCWLCRNPQAMLAMRRAKILPRFEQASMTQENVQRLAGLDWAQIANTWPGWAKDMEPYYLEGVTAQILRKLKAPLDPALAGVLISKLLDSNTLKATSTYLSENPRDIPSFQAGSLQFLIHNPYAPGKRTSLENVRWVEQVLRATPELQAHWKTLWTLPGRKDEPRAKTDLVNQDPRPTNLIELLLYESPAWIYDKMLETGPLAQRMIQVLGNGNNLELFIHKIDPADGNRIAPILVRHFPDRTDSEGHNFSWALLNKTKSSTTLRKIAAQDNGLTLLAHTNAAGECTLDLAGRLTELAGQKPYLDSLRRRTLNQQLKDQGPLPGRDKLQKRAL